MTKGGEDPLLSAEDNCAEPIGMPNALEVNHAFTRRISHLFCVVSATFFNGYQTNRGLLAPLLPIPLLFSSEKPPREANRVLEFYQNKRRKAALKRNRNDPLPSNPSG